jgi:hypothetical protein
LHWGFCLWFEASAFWLFDGEGFWAFGFLDVGGLWKGKELLKGKDC